MNKDETPLGWYPWFPRDFTTSIVVRSMSFTARAIYRELLDIQWEHGCLTSVERMLNIIGATSQQWTEFAPYMDELFPNGVNPKLHELREDAKKRQLSKSLAGKKSAEARRNQVQNEQLDNESSTSVEQVLNTSSTKHKHKHNISNSFNNELLREKPKKTPKEKFDAKSICLSDILGVQQVSPSFLDAWHSFIDHRKEIGHPLTERSATIILKRFVGVKSDVVIESINKSISSGWRDVYIKETQPQSREKVSGVTQVQRLLDKLDEQGEDVRAIG